MGLCCTTLRFNLIEPIGGVEGKNSTVYKAFDPQLNTYLIVKRISKKSIIEQYGSIDESNFLMNLKFFTIVNIQMLWKYNMLVKMKTLYIFQCLYVKTVQ